MNFSQAVKGYLTRFGAIRAIQSQAETELGRKLSKEEEYLLSSKTHPNIFLGQIQKVYYHFCQTLFSCFTFTVRVRFPQVSVVLGSEA
jgi:hypothetical protein